MVGGIDHDRNSLVPSVDVRIRAPQHEPTLNGAHSRNESTDSGLSVSSLTRTADRMLSSVDHMDTGEPGEPSSLTLQDTLPAMTQGEELMPCIPEGLSSDLLMDMETVLSGSHMDRDSLLTWL
ncbi:transcriptional coactivator YAP1-B-like [Entelurus aequoreus]|nr:transcriptional coactivator YAP1-B-like [Entelurus aequoreus]